MLYLRTHFTSMKKDILTIISLIFIISAFFAKVDISSLESCGNDEVSHISDRQKSDIESIFKIGNSNKTTLPQLQDSLPSPSFRLLPSQKRNQQNLINNILLKRFSAEAQPTDNYNTKFSFPLSSKEDLIVIVRHLII